MTRLNSFNDSQNEIQELLGTIINWGADFQKKNSLNFISSEQLLDVYNRLENLKDKFFYDRTLGKESELSDKAVIWMWKLMLLRKKQSERRYD